MKVDLHLHDNKYSTDSHISIEEIVREAKRKGLDGIALTCLLYTSDAADD